MTYLLLHGGAGPASVAAFAGRLPDVLAPTHPGFDGTPRPAGLTTIRDVAEHYAAQLDELDLDDVTVVGNSIGGWIAAELALLRPRRVSRLVLVDAVGIEVPGHPVADFFSLSMPEIAQLSYADPSRFTPPPPPPNPENRKTLQVYAGEQSFVDPSLHARLAGITQPTLVVWGESDGIADLDYGRAFAAAIPGAEFRALPHTGHLPQIESPDLLLAAIQEFTARSTV
ncbi:pimeloyl-ACP methyl ester carboxylesterase [Actinoplanes tereljensis]|uniref:Alpha/beta hydrolase n=1 Tax=Paractinoplanes tereljensis TaxID=571912 RepID=A0A919TQ28_9ACTN|nr:alpha/beta hydrolase [Actinoplanes tereljensis]GIF17719.1 alpha/beta hydrolase [Actinoplanes tereljensis]